MKELRKNIFVYDRDTMFYASNTDFETRSTFIDCEIKGLTLSEEAYTIYQQVDQPSSASGKC